MAPQKPMSSWGCYPTHLAQTFSPNEEESAAVMVAHANTIPRGLGRSYGDSALADNLLSSARLRHLLAFDPLSGIVHCQSGVNLGEIIETFLPQGLFLAVTPGTKYVTVGGAIASDVHGKNHHQAGCFSDFVEEIELLLPEGKKINISREKSAEIFYATCGGMGLTGFILSAKLRLKKISSGMIDQEVLITKNLEETLDALLERKKVHYSVAWLDSTASGKNLGRSIIFLGEHSEHTESQPAYTLPRVPKKYISDSLIKYLLNPLSIKAFNTCYYHAPRPSKQSISIERFFYPLDRSLSWNTWYGANGFTQYQFVIPLHQKNAFRKILSEIQHFGTSSFLSVLKILGPSNNNFLSFPMEGLTLSCDFKITPTLWAFLDKLDQHILEAGGRVYLAKDCRLSAETFRAMYPQKNIEAFLTLREKLDPSKKLSSLQSRRLKL